MWLNCPLNILFYLFFVYGQCFVLFAFFVSTMIKSLDQANQLSYSIILANILVECTFSNTPFTLKLFYSDAVVSHTFVKVWTWFLEMAPTFSFSMAFGQICFVASKRFHFDSISWIDGRKITMDDYYASTEMISKTTLDVIHTKPIAHFVHCINQTSVGLFILFWYFDHILSSNRGVAYSLYFPF